MKVVRLKEYAYIKKYMSKTQGISIESKNAGLMRIYMVPPKRQWNRMIPYLLIINGQKMMPVGISWAVMFRCLIDRLANYPSQTIDRDNYEILIEEAIVDTKSVYPAMHIQELRKEMNVFLDELTRQDKAVAINAFHPIRSEKEYEQSFKKAGNAVWQFPDSTIARKESIKLEKINGMRKGGPV